MYAMIEQASIILHKKQDEITSDLKKVHQRHHNSEHPFSLAETDIVKNWLNEGHEISELDPAFHAFNKERKSRLSTFEGIKETLSILLKSNINIIAHSDSNSLAVIDKLSRLGLIDYFSKIYCVKDGDTQHPNGGPLSSTFETFPYQKIHHLEIWEKKPNPEIINHIMRENDLTTENTFYVGDSLSKDIYMANKAKIHSIWAKYGNIHNPEYYEKLLRISHWSDDDIEMEKKLRGIAADTVPEFVCNSGFYEVLEFLGLKPKESTVEHSKFQSTR